MYSLIIVLVNTANKKQSTSKTYTTCKSFGYVLTRGIGFSMPDCRSGVLHLGLHHKSESLRGYYVHALVVEDQKDAGEVRSDCDQRLHAYCWLPFLGAKLVKHLELFADSCVLFVDYLVSTQFGECYFDSFV